MAHKAVLIGKRLSVSDAKSAYFEGDFERCLEICSDMRVGSVATASEIALLKARAFLRTARPREAQSVIVDSLETHTTLDAALTAQMLVATARIRQDDADTGIAILLDAASRAGDAHLAVRSEIEFCTALGYWAKRDIETAEMHLAHVDPRSDIIHARALELQAWCHTARHDFRRSAQAFEATLIRLDRCKAHDRAIAATALSTLSILATELFDRELARFVETRARAMDWPAGVSAQHYLTVAHQAMFHEFNGDTLAAYQYAARAREVAPTVAFEALGWCLGSAIARNARESFTAILFAQRAQELVETLDPRELLGEERFALLSVAEASAYFDLDRATELVARYWRLAPVDAMLSLSGDPRLDGEETFIAGIIAQAQGERERAVTCFRNAFTTFKNIGYVRRAAIAGQALLALNDDPDVRVFLSERLAGTANYVVAFLRGDDDRFTTLERHPIVAALPNSQREIVALLCLGKTNKEIAQLRNVGEQTIKNLLTKHIFPAFGVSSRAALVSACLRTRAAGE